MRNGVSLVIEYHQICAIDAKRMHWGLEFQLYEARSVNTRLGYRGACDAWLNVTPIAEPEEDFLALFRGQVILLRQIERSIGSQSEPGRSELFD